MSTPSEIIDSQLEMVCRFRRDGTILFVNAAYARARGTTVEHLTGANFWHFVPEQDQDAVRASLDRLTPDAPELRIENRFETTDGIRWTLWLNRALTFDDAGRALELQSTGLDITDRRRAEDALRQSEARYRRIFDTAGVSIWDEDFSAIKRALDALEAQGVRDFAAYFRQHPEWVDRAIGLVRITHVNPATLRLFEADTEAELLSTLHRIFVPATRAAFVAELLAIAEKRQSFEAEATLQTLKGRPVDVLVTITFPPPDDPFTSVLVTLTDITERKRIESRLRESEARFRSFADTAPAMVWVTDPDGTCSFLSHAWYEYTGQHEDQALGNGWLDPVHPDDRARLDTMFRRATADRAPFELEYRLRRADGAYRWAIHAGRPRFSGDRAFLGFVGSCIDIHPRKEIEEALQKSNEMKDEFLATLSHELRTPLNAVLGWAHMLRSGALTPDVQVRALESLERNARAQTQLIDDLLDMSRIVSGRLQIELQPIDLLAVIAAAADTLRPAAVLKRVDIQIITHATEVIRVRGDADRLRQVLWNLLSNAIKFTPGGGRVQLEVRCTSTDVEVIVSDTGEGIDPAFLPHVFERFRQADSSSTRRHGGLGLGLSIAHHLAVAHGGSITATSDGRDRGATFTLRLPRERGMAAYADLRLTLQDGSR